MIILPVLALLSEYYSFWKTEQEIYLRSILGLVKPYFQIFLVTHNTHIMKLLCKLAVFISLAILANCNDDGSKDEASVEDENSCTVNGMQVPGCNDDWSDEVKAEIAAEKAAKAKEQAEKEANMTEEERAAMQKKEYKKLFYTNNYDWEIRFELDEADDVIHKSPVEAIGIFEDILKRYPDSPRAYYALARCKVSGQKHCRKTI